ncbi:MAG: hypothetical protein ACK5KU_02440 [Beutenbergiaceae bacterium]
MTSIRLSMAVAATAAALLVGCSLPEGEAGSDYDYEPIDFGAVGDVTPPGTELSFGDIAWVDKTSTVIDENGDEVELSGMIGITVHDVVAGEPSFFDQYSNSSDFEGYTPYFIVIQYQWDYEIPENTSPPLLALFPMSADGEDLEFLTGAVWSVSATSDECGISLPEYDPETQVGMRCVVGLSTDKPVEMLAYNGESYSAMVGTPGNEYLEAPVLWTAAASE